MKNKVCATVQYQVNIYCNAPVSDAILKNIFVQKFHAFSLSSTADIHKKKERKKGNINENTDEESSCEDEISSSISQ